MKYWPISLGLLTLLAGYGSDPKLYPVSGTVTWNGAALPNGDIIFEPVDGQVAPDAGKIRNGTFSFAASAGKKRVRIHASREVPGKIDPVMKSPVREDYIPERYNSRTELEEEVTPGGKNEFVFKLREKP